jgi:hypothetical protein
MRAHPALGYVFVGLIGLVVGYFVGREHLKYEVLNTFQSAVQDIQKGLAPGLGGYLAAQRSEKTAAIPPSQAAKPKHDPEPVEISLATKGFKASNPSAGDFEDDITLVLSINNVSDRDIRAFDGILDFTDLLDNEIMKISLAVNDPIKAGAILTWKGGIKYNQFIEQHQRLRAAQQDNIRVRFSTKKVLFSDGHTEEYGER